MIYITHDQDIRRVMHWSIPVCTLVIDNLESNYNNNHNNITIDSNTVTSTGIVRIVTMETTMKTSMLLPIFVVFLFINLKTTLVQAGKKHNFIYISMVQILWSHTWIYIIMILYMYEFGNRNFEIPNKEYDINIVMHNLVTNSQTDSKLKHLLLV